MKQIIQMLSILLIALAAMGCATVSSELESTAAGDLALYAYVHQVADTTTTKVSADLRTVSTQEFEHSHLSSLAGNSVLFDQDEAFYLRAPNTEGTDPVNLFVAAAPTEDGTESSTSGSYDYLTLDAIALGSEYLFGYTDKDAVTSEYAVQVPSSAVTVTAPAASATVSLNDGFTVTWDVQDLGDDTLLLTWIPTVSYTNPETEEVTGPNDIFFGEYLDGDSNGTIVPNTGSYEYSFSDRFVTLYNFVHENYTVHNWNLYLMRRSTFHNEAASPFSETYVTYDLITKVPVTLQ